MNPSVVDYKYDLVLCSGSRTVIPAYLLAKHSGARVVYIGTPKFRLMKRFDGIVSTKKDLSNVYKVITTDLPPTKFSPYKKQQEAIKRMSFAILLMETAICLRAPCVSTIAS